MPCVSIRDFVWPTSSSQATKEKVDTHKCLSVDSIVLYEAKEKKIEDKVNSLRLFKGRQCGHGDLSPVCPINICRHNGPCRWLRDGDRCHWCLSFDLSISCFLVLLARLSRLGSLGLWLTRGNEFAPSNVVVWSKRKQSHQRASTYSIGSLTRR